jgi:hypothetical protein
MVDWKYVVGRAYLSETAGRYVLLKSILIAQIVLSASVLGSSQISGGATAPRLPFASDFVVRQDPRVCSLNPTRPGFCYARITAYDDD